MFSVHGIITNNWRCQEPLSGFSELRWQVFSALSYGVRIESRATRSAVAELVTQTVKLLCASVRENQSRRGEANSVSRCRSSTESCCEPREAAWPTCTPCQCHTREVILANVWFGADAIAATFGEKGSRCLEAFYVVGAGPL